MTQETSIAMVKYIHYGDASGEYGQTNVKNLARIMDAENQT